MLPCYHLYVADVEADRFNVTPSDGDALVSQRKTVPSPSRPPLPFTQIPSCREAEF